MSEDRGAVREVVWRELFPSLCLLRVPRLAASFRALALAALALVGMVAGWRMIGGVFSNSTDPVLQAWIAADQPWPWEGSLATGEAPERTSDADKKIVKTDRSASQSAPDAKSASTDIREIAGQFYTDLRTKERAAATGALTDAAQKLVKENLSPSVQTLTSANPVVGVWNHLGTPFVRLFSWRVGAANVSLVAAAYALCCGLWALFLWSAIGGAIVRQTAVSLAREEHLSFGQTIAYGSSKWASLFMAPLFPMIGAAAAAVPAMLLGLLLNFGAGAIVAGLLWFVLLLFALLMAVLLVGLLFGWPLMWATIGVEGTDAFDALSRSYAYTFQRPLRYFLYVLAAGALGVLAVFVVDLVANQVIQLAFWGASWGAGSDDVRSAIDATEGIAGVGAQALGFWTNLVKLLAAAFAYSYFWTATTAIYFLLRRQVDAVEMDEVFLSEQDQSYDLPPLEADAAGVPGVPADPTTTPPSSPEG